MFKTVKLQPKSPFSLHESLRQIENWNLSLYFSYSGDTYFQSLTLETFSTAFALTWNGSIGKPELALDIPKELSKTQTELVVEAVSRQFNLSLDLGHMRKTIKDVRLVNLMDERVGYHPVIFPSPWECISHAIISSQVTDKLTQRVLEQLMVTYGTKLEWQGMDFLCFPRPDQFIHAKQEDLRAMQLSNRKAEYLIGLSQLLVKNPTFFPSLFHKSADEIRENLLKIRGIGPYTASFAVTFGFGRMTEIQVIQGGFQHVVSVIYDLPELTEREYLSILDSWKMYREVGLFYLWGLYDERKKEKRKSKK